MHSSCLNCAAPLAAADHFCARCGQSTHLHRFSLGHIAHEFFHAFTHADKGLLLLLRELALRPGQVLRHYIQEGKRARYFNPFTLLLLVLGFALLLNSVMHPYTGRQAQAEVRVPARIRTEQGRASYLAARHRQQQVMELVEKRANFVTLLALPILALVYWLLLRQAGLRYAEHLVAQVLLGGFYMLASTLLLPLVLLPGLQKIALYGGPMLLQISYLSWAYYQFLGQRGTWPLVRSVLVACLALLTWVVVSYGAIFAYVKFG